ncbi:gp53-like domain-containing protein [Xenorhabdus kozodoii]|uniref:NgrE n=1 Tax=Xenorhabdus kozodoii TaxID=351676 RepID=A0A2D0LF57_9GAMM|nr:hypothetical protein [Xenorhabdus kozodoii]PHM74282.1 NgrE [Xenorhabdus kozodoii]
MKNLGLSDTVDRAGNAYPKVGGTVYGDVNATGYISGVGVYESGGRRVYSPVNKPTPDDIGAYSKKGGVVNGNVDVTGYVSANAIYDSGSNRVYSPNNPPPATTEVLFGSAGWYRDKSNGVIIQWGSGTYTDGQLVKFLRPFTTAACAVTISTDPRATPYIEVALAHPTSLAEFVVGCAVFTGSAFLKSDLACTWIAIGY